MEVAEELSVVVQAAKLRLILLGLLIDAIDALPSGGDILISAQCGENGMRIEIADSRAAEMPTSFIVSAIDELAPLLTARIDRKQSATAGCQVRLDLPA
jgi:signal transduction histidine kinase